MKVCPFTVSYIYAILQHSHEKFRLDLEINVLFSNFWHSTSVIVRLSFLLILELRLYGSLPLNMPIPMFLLPFLQFILCS